MVWKMLPGENRLFSLNEIDPRNAWNNEVGDRLSSSADIEIDSSTITPPHVNLLAPAITPGTKVIAKKILHPLECHLYTNKRT